MKNLLRLVTLLLLAQPLPLLAQPAASAQGRIDAALSRAEAARVPAALLQDKVAEGRAKGVPLERIAAAVEQRAALLIRAQEVMGGAGRSVRAADLSVGADALNAGVSTAALRTLSEAAPERSRTLAIAVLSQLVTQGHASEEALARVRAALARGGDELMRLPAEAARGRAAGGEAPGKGVGRGGGPPAGVPATGAPAGRPGKGPPDGKGPPPGRGKPGG